MCTVWDVDAIGFAIYLGEEKRCRAGESGKVEGMVWVGCPPVLMPVEGEQRRGEVSCTVSHLSPTKIISLVALKSRRKLEVEVLPVVRRCAEGPQTTSCVSGIGGEGLWRSWWWW